MVTHTLAGAVCHSKLKCKQVWVIKKKSHGERVSYSRTQIIEQHV